MAGRHRTWRRWSQEEKRQIVAQTLVPGMSVSQVSTDKINWPTGRTIFLTHPVDCRRGSSRGRFPEQSTLSGLLQPVAVTADLEHRAMVL